MYLQAKIDANIKEQRDAFKASRSSTPDIPNTKPSLAGVLGAQQGAARGRAPEPTIKIVAAHPGPTGAAPMTPPGAKKIFISRDGKIIGHQLTLGSAGTTTGAVGGVAMPLLPKVAIAPTPMTVAGRLAPAAPAAAAVTLQQTSSPAVTPSSLPAAAAAQQKVQIVKLADGKIQVRGWLTHMCTGIGTLSGMCVWYS